MSDLISRESLKQRINLNYNNRQYIDTQSIKDIINTEPSVEDKTVEELEKIKAKFDNDLNLYKNEYDSTYNCSLDYIKGIITCKTIVDKCIEELKGEDDKNDR